jgi:hypothetical protein
MISFLRKEVDRAKRVHESTWSTANQSAVMFYQNASQMGLGNISNSNIVVEHLRPKEEDSLCFSRDPSR